MPGSPEIPLLTFTHVPQFMGIETSADHGGAECGFTSAIIVIEGQFGVVSFFLYSLCAFESYPTISHRVTTRRRLHKHVYEKGGSCDPSSYIFTRRGRTFVVHILMIFYLPHSLFLFPGYRTRQSRSFSISTLRCSQHSCQYRTQKLCF